LKKRQDFIPGQNGRRRNRDVGRRNPELGIEKSENRKKRKS